VSRKRVNGRARHAQSAIPGNVQNSVIRTIFRPLTIDLRSSARRRCVCSGEYSSIPPPLRADHPSPKQRQQSDLVRLSPTHGQGTSRRLASLNHQNVRLNSRLPTPLGKCCRAKDSSTSPLHVHRDIMIKTTSRGSNGGFGLPKA
jgi:hypothetical protein